jgi:dynein heavy chain
VISAKFQVIDPPKKVYQDIESGSDQLIKKNKLVPYDTWKLKVIQLYETSLVRHGFMLVGPTLCGKTEIMQTLTNCMSEFCSNPHRIVTMNPKAITDSQMYGIKDMVSEEWTPGVFASIWAKYNNRQVLQFSVSWICSYY